VPNCFVGWKQACFFIAMGDAAAELANLLLPAGEGRDLQYLRNLLKQLEDHSIPDMLPEIQRRRDKLVSDVKPYISAVDPVSLDFAMARIRKDASEALDEAQGAYYAAGVRDGRYGVAWLRLASLKWSIANYREGLLALTGPAPQPRLEAARFPLELAVRLGGGRLAFSNLTGRWKSPAETLLTIEGPDASQNVILNAAHQNQPGTSVGQCTISGLPAADAELIAAFLRRYEPGILRSAGKGTFEEWITLIQVPTPGQHGAIATAMEQGALFATLAAGVSLGMPKALHLPGIDAAEERPHAWLEAETIVSLEW
jgi:hypothetical protein